MKLPKTFIPEKNLEQKTKDLVWGNSKRKELSYQEVKSYYWKFITLQRDKDCTVEHVHDFFKGLSYEDALRITEYGKVEKEKRDKFLEGLADIP